MFWNIKAYIVVKHFPVLDDTDKIETHHSAQSHRDLDWQEREENDVDTRIRVHVSRRADTSEQCSTRAQGWDHLCPRQPRDREQVRDQRRRHTRGDIKRQELLHAHRVVQGNRKRVQCKHVESEMPKVLVTEHGGQERDRLPTRWVVHEPLLHKGTPAGHLPCAKDHRIESNDRPDGALARGVLHPALADHKHHFLDLNRDAQLLDPAEPLAELTELFLHHLALFLDKL